MFYSKSTNGFYDPSINDNIPPDSVEITEQEWKSLLSGQADGQIIKSNDDGFPVLGDPTIPNGEEKVSICMIAAQQFLDKFARSWGYDSIASGISYINSTNKQYKADAVALNKWRDKYWEAVYKIPVTKFPSTIEEFVALLPAAPSKPSI